MPFFLWLRFITRQKILILGRFHLAAQQRDARREVSIFRGALPEASTEALAAQLLGHLTTPTVAARRAEMALHLQQALNQLPEDDRQILVLRHFEQLSNAEAARELGIQESTASKRYLRALLKLKGILAPLGVEI